MSKRKDELKEAVSNIGGDQLQEALTGMFENVELDEGSKTQFAGIFEGAVKATAVELAESYIVKAEADAQQLVENKVQELTEAAEQYSQYLKEEYGNKIDLYLNHLVESFMEENKLTVVNSLKVTMFDSLVEGLKTMFVENNIECPDEKTNIVESLEEELESVEAKFEAQLTETADLKSQLKSFQKDKIISEALASSGLTDVQKEKVQSLVEGLSWSDDFANKVASVIEVASGKSKIVLTEKKEDPEGNPEYSEKEPDGDEPESEKDDDADANKKKKMPLKESTTMQSYINAVRRK